MAVQQRRVTPSRKGMRRSHHALTPTTLTECKKCGKSILPHRVCNACGFYKNKKIINIEN
ncbi:MAG: 50S ribosomal protein L32 [Malacoplasma sp.]